MFNVFSCIYEDKSLYKKFASSWKLALDEYFLKIWSSYFGCVYIHVYVCINAKFPASNFVSVVCLFISSNLNSSLTLDSNCCENLQLSLYAEPYRQ